MMMYRVIRYFTDLQDNDYAYNVGDVYPRQGMSVTAERFAELASSENRQKTPLIEAVDEPDAEVSAEDVAEIEDEPKQKRKRKAN
jgi:hypothetical protein